MPGFLLSSLLFRLSIFKCELYSKNAEKQVTENTQAVQTKDGDVLVWSTTVSEKEALPRGLLGRKYHWSSLQVYVAGYVSCSQSDGKKVRKALFGEKDDKTSGENSAALRPSPPETLVRRNGDKPLVLQCLADGTRSGPVI